MGKLSRIKSKNDIETKDGNQKKISNFFQPGSKKVPEKKQTSSLFSSIGNEVKKTSPKSSATNNGNIKPIVGNSCNSPICIEEDMDSDVIPDTPKCDKIKQSKSTADISKYFGRPVENGTDSSSTYNKDATGVKQATPTKENDDVKPVVDKTKAFTKNRGFLHSATEFTPKAFLGKRTTVNNTGTSRLNNDAKRLSDLGASSSIEKPMDASFLPTESLKDVDDSTGGNSLSMVMIDMGIHEDAQRAMGLSKRRSIEQLRAEVKETIKSENNAESLDITEFCTQEVVSKRIKRSPSRGNSPNPKKFVERTTPPLIAARPKMQLDFEPAKKPEIKPIDKYAMFEQEKKLLAEKAKEKNNSLKGKKWGITKHSLKNGHHANQHIDYEEDDGLEGILNEIKAPPKFTITSKFSKEKTVVRKEETNPLHVDNGGSAMEDEGLPSDMEDDDGLDDIIGEIRSQYATQESDLTKSLSKVARPVQKKVPNKKHRVVSCKKTLHSQIGTSPKESFKERLPVVTSPDVETSSPPLKHIPKEEMDTTQNLDELIRQMDQSFEEMRSPTGKMPEFPPMCKGYGRHLVLEVNNEGNEIHLDLETYPEQEKRKAILKGFWSDTHVRKGDIVNITGTLDKDGVYEITDKSSILVVNPDKLITPTEIVRSISCMRRSVFNDKFKGVEARNIHMLNGSILHSFFQEALKLQAFSPAALEPVADSVLRTNNFMHDMYGLNTTEVAVREEMNKFTPEIMKFAEKFVRPATHTFGQQCAPTNIAVRDIADIEENVWSPRYGIKGKVDLTVDVKIHDKKTNKSVTKLMPLELKTGKPTFSMEHKGQVTLYSMMCSDRRDDPDGGLLLYLRECVMQDIPAEHAHKRGLMQLRNELSHYIKTSLEKVERSPGEETSSSWQFGPLPKPVNNERMCPKCPQLLNCAAYQKCIEKTKASPDHIMKQLVPVTLEHLSSAHLDYYVHWCHLLHLEESIDKKRSALSNIWCKSGKAREKIGECFSGLYMIPGAKRMGLESFAHKFYRDHSGSLAMVGLGKTDSVIISAENKPYLALAIGTITELSEKEVTVVVDRDLKQFYDDRSIVYRIDRNDSFNSMSSNFTWVSKLMENTEAAARMRELVIEKKPPCFELTLSKTKVHLVRDIFKRLNKPQKTAILKVLMSQDYVLIKGYPGTGKTSTIVALVRILVTLGMSVLLTSYTHSAVDNILLKLQNYSIDFVRLGRVEKIHEDIKQYSSARRSEQMSSVQELAEFYESKSVVATTCLGTNHPIFLQRKFDVCIVDEASQVLQPTCLGPLFCSKKFVLVGDPLQLPPVVQNKEAVEQGMSESLFARLDDAGGTYELNLQYRMNSEIMRLSNELVYNGALKCGTKQTADNRLPLPNLCSLSHTIPGWLKTTLSPADGREVVFLNVDDVTTMTQREPKLTPRKTQINSGVQNLEEANVVKTVCEKAILAGLPADDIGVIAPYRQQVKLLKDLIHSKSEVDMSHVEINTVDQYQGRDKGMIIVSFVKGSSSDGPVSQILKDLRRLNVALTRAKQKLVLVGSVSGLKQYEPLKKVISILRPTQIIGLPLDALEGSDFAQL